MAQIEKFFPELKRYTYDKGKEKVSVVPYGEGHNTLQEAYQEGLDMEGKVKETDGVEIHYFFDGQVLTAFVNK